MNSKKIEATEDVRQKVIKFVTQNGYITNRQCRLLLGIGYGQAITVFRKFVDSGDLIREGKTSSVRYRLPIK